MFKLSSNEVKLEIQVQNEWKTEEKIESDVWP